MGSFPRSLVSYVLSVSFSSSSAMAHSPQAYHQHTVLDAFQPLPSFPSPSGQIFSAASPPDYSSSVERCSADSSDSRRSRCDPTHDTSLKTEREEELFPSSPELSFPSRTNDLPQTASSSIAEHQEGEFSVGRSQAASSSPPLRTPTASSSSFASRRPLSNSPEKCRSFSSSSSSALASQRTLSPGIHSSSSPCFSTNSALPPINTPDSPAPSSSSSWASSSLLPVASPPSYFGEEDEDGSGSSSPSSFIMSSRAPDPTAALAKEGEEEEEHATPPETSADTPTAFLKFSGDSSSKIIRENPLKAFEREELKETMEAYVHPQRETLSSSSSLFSLSSSRATDGRPESHHPLSFLEALGHASAAEAAALGGGAWDLSLWGLGAFQRSFPSMFSAGKTPADAEDASLEKAKETEKGERKHEGGGKEEEEGEGGELRRSLLELKAKTTLVAEEGEGRQQDLGLGGRGGGRQEAPPSSSSWYSVFKSKVQSVFDRIDKRIAESNGMLVHGDLYEFPL